MIKVDIDDSWWNGNELMDGWTDYAISRVAFATDKNLVTQGLVNWW